MTKKGKGQNGDNAGPRGGSPPPEYQWPKGTSGNPKGRPRKPAAEKMDLNIAAMTVADALRPITITEGGKPQSMPRIEAVKRAQLVNALKGNSYAMRSYIQQAADAQAQQHKREQEAIAAALGLKIDLELKRVEWVAGGREENAMPLHPSDIEIDMSTGEVRYFLAFTAEDRKARAKLVELRDYLLEVIARSVATIEEDGDDMFLGIGREASHRAIVEINRRLPARCRRVPTGQEPPVSVDSSPEQIWKAMMEPVTDLLFAPRSKGEQPGASPSSS